MVRLENNPGCPDGNIDELGGTKKARWELLVREMSQLLGAPSVDHSDGNGCPAAIFLDEDGSGLELEPDSFAQAG